MVTISLPSSPVITAAEIDLGDHLWLRLGWGQGGGPHVLQLPLPGGALPVFVRGQLELGGKVGSQPRLRTVGLEVVDADRIAEQIVLLHADRADTFFQELERALSSVVDAVLAEARGLVDKLVPPPFAPDLRPDLRAALTGAHGQLRAALLSPLVELRLAVVRVARGFVQLAHHVGRAARFLHVLLSDPVGYFKAEVPRLARELPKYGAALQELLVLYARRWESAFLELFRTAWSELVRASSQPWQYVEELLVALWKSSSSFMTWFAGLLRETLSTLSATATAELERLASGAVWMWKQLASGGGRAWAHLARVVVDVTASVLEAPETLRAFCERLLLQAQRHMTATVAQFGELLTGLGDLRLVVAVCDLVARGDAVLRGLIRDAEDAARKLFAALELLLDGMGVFLTTQLATVQGVFHGLTALPVALDQAGRDAEAFRKQLEGGFASMATAILLEAKDTVEHGVDRSPLLRAIGQVVKALFDLLQRVTGLAGPPAGEALDKEAARRLEAEWGKLHGLAHDLSAFLLGGAPQVLAVGGAPATSGVAAGGVRLATAPAASAASATPDPLGAVHGAGPAPLTIRCRPQHVSIAALQGGDVELGDAVPDFLRGEGADTIINLFQDVFGIKELTLLDIQVFSQRAETPPPTAITSAGLPDEPAETELETRLPTLVLPPLPDLELAPTVRLAPGARFFPVDPRYASAYGSSLQLGVADVDGDGAIAAWELARARAALGKADAHFDVDKDGVVTADDLRLITEQARHMVNGVPYTEAAAPLGLLADWPHGSWLYVAAAPLTDEDIGARPVPLGTVYRTGTKVDRTGLGLFAHGQLNVPDLTGGLLALEAQCRAPGGAPAYPVRFALESRAFVDVFPQTPPLFAPGASTVVVLRGGARGNDWQLRLRTNEAAPLVPVPPLATWGFTLRGMLQLTGTGAYVAAIEGALKLGLEYTCTTPIIDLLQRLRHVVDVGIDAAGALTDPDKALEAVVELLRLEECARLGMRVAAPWLGVIGFDAEHEAALMVVERLLSWDDEAFSPGLLSTREVLQGACGPSGIEGMATGWAWRGPVEGEGTLEARLRELDERRDALRTMLAQRLALEARRRPLEATLAQRDRARAEVAALEAERARASGFTRMLLDARLLAARQQLACLEAGAPRAARELALLDEELAPLPALDALQASLAACEAERQRVSAELAAELARGGREQRLRVRCAELEAAHERAREWRRRPQLLEELKRRVAQEPDPAVRERLAAENARLSRLAPPDAATLRRAGVVDRVLERLVEKVSIDPELEALQAELDDAAPLRVELAKVVTDLEPRAGALAAELQRARLEAQLPGLFGKPLFPGAAARVERLEREQAQLEPQLAQARARLAELEARLRQLEARLDELRRASGARPSDGERLDERFMDAWCGASRMARIHVWRDLVTEDRLEHYGPKLQVALQGCADDLAAGRLSQALERLRQLLSGLEGFDPAVDAQGLGDAPLAVIELLQLVVAQALALKRLGDTIVDPAGTLKEALGLDEKELTLGKPKAWSWSLTKKSGKTTPPAPESKEDTWDVLRPMREEMRRKAREAAAAKDQGDEDAETKKKKKEKEKKEGSLPLLSFGEDTLSIVWSLDGGAGVGAGGEGGGSGAAATVTAGLTFEPPELSFPMNLLVDLRSLVVLGRLLLKLGRHLLGVLDAGDRHFRDRSVTFTSLLEASPRLAVQLLIALAEALKELVRDEPIWLEELLNGCKLTIALKGKLEGQAAAVVGVEARGQVTAQATVTLATLLDPVVTILSRAGRDLPRASAGGLLADRIVPKVEMTIEEEVTASVRASVFEGVLTVNGTILAGDFLLPDGSPWRQQLEAWLNDVADAVWDYGAIRADVEPAPALRGLMAILEAADGVLAGSVDPLDVPLHSVVGPPSVTRIMDTLLNPGATVTSVGEEPNQLEVCLKALDGTKPLRTREGLGVVEDSAEHQGRSRVSACFADAHVSRLAGVARAPQPLENATHVLDPGGLRPASVIWNASSDETAAVIYAAGARTQGLALGFEAHAECLRFVAWRRAARAAWVTGPAHVEAVWDHAGRWYAWLTTSIGADCAGAGLTLPDVSIRSTDRRVALRFEHVARGATLPLEDLGYGPRQRPAGDDLYQRVVLLDGAGYGAVQAVQAKLFELAGV